MKIHPAAKAFPVLSGQELSGLVEDIRQNGQRFPVVFDRDVLLDGRNRIKACEELGRDYEWDQWDRKGSAVDFILSANLHRRHLTASQRAMVGLELLPQYSEKIPKGRPQNERNRALLFGKASEHVARAVGVSPRYIEYARRVKEADPELAQRVSNGEILLPAALREVNRAADAKARPRSRTCRVAELSRLIETGKRFGTIYADPPWQYGNQATRAATDNHYTTMTVEQLARLPVADLADKNAHLHLWTTNGFLREAIDLISEWGFEYKSCFVWVKPQMGIGNYWRVSHEFLLLGVRGSCPFLEHDEMSWRQIKRGRHSAKPLVMREILQRVSPGPRLELFGRELHKGWTVWGNEVAPTLLTLDAEVM